MHRLEACPSLVQDEAPIRGGDQVPRKTGSGDLGQSPPEAEGFCANTYFTIFCIAGQFAETLCCVVVLVLKFSLLLRSKLEFMVQIFLGEMHPLNYVYWVHSHPLKQLYCIVL